MLSSRRKKRTETRQTKSSHFSILICSVCLVSQWHFCVQAWRFCATWLCSQVIPGNESNVNCFSCHVNMEWQCLSHQVYIKGLLSVCFRNKKELYLEVNVSFCYWLAIIAFLWVLYPGLPLLLFLPTACVVGCRRTARDCVGLLLLIVQKMFSFRHNHHVLLLPFPEWFYQLARSGD